MEALQKFYVFAGQPFSDDSLAIVLSLAGIYFIAFLARGALGFGAIAPAVVITSLLIPPHHAVLLALVTGTLPQIQLMPEGIRDGDWHIARPVLLGMLITIPAGVWVFANLSSDWFALVLGSIIAILMALDLTKALERLLAGVDLRSTKVAFWLSTATGFLNGLAGSGGIVTLVLYLKHACPDHVSLRATLILLGTAMLLWRLLATVVAGLITVKLAAEAILLVPAVYGGVWMGRRYFRTVTPAFYHRLLQIIILLSALMLVIDGVNRVT